MGRFRTTPEWRFFAVLRAGAGRLAVLWWTLAVVRGLLPPAFAVVVGVLVDAVQDHRSLGMPLALMAATFVAMQALGPVHDATSATVGARASEWLHDVLLRASIDPPGLAHLEDQGSADDLAAARDFDLGVTGPNLTVAMPNIGSGLTALVSGAAYALLLARYRWWAFAVVAAAWGSTHWLLKEGAVWRARFSPESAERQRRATYSYRLAVDAPAAKEVRLFGLPDWVLGGFRELRHALLDESWEQRRLSLPKTRNAILAIVAANVAVFWSLGHDATRGAVELGALVVFIQAAIGANALAFGEFDWWLRTSVQPIPVVLGLAERMAETGALPNGHRVADGLPRQEIRFADVSFRYPGSDRNVFRGLDLVIPAGQSLAIVGVNGAGKTTLAKLLCRMYDPDGGEILVDGIPLRELDLAAWRARVTAVFQDFVRYELSLRDNVAPLGADDETVQAALAEGGAAAVAELSTTLSRAYEGGTDLSGGQWQRVALARALCAVHLGAGVVVLDEPTAQLDVRGETEIFEGLLRATRGCTTILVSHRFSTVRRADRICVLEHGEVVEQGSHDDLMASGGRYRTMFELQASRFEDEPESVE